MLIPSFVGKMVQNAPITFDINAKLRYNQIAWLGVSYRRDDAVVGLVGVTAKKLIDIGYAYDFTTSAVKQFSSGTHEIMLGLRLPNHQHHPPPAQFW
jgi:type IX secretion system PorP/SprF family membrane protein